MATVSGNRQTGKKWSTALVLNVLLGFTGAHRFYTGHFTVGIIQLLTLGGFFVWTLTDLVLIITGVFRDVHGLRLQRNSKPVGPAVVGQGSLLLSAQGD